MTTVYSVLLVVLAGPEVQHPRAHGLLPGRVPGALHEEGRFPDPQCGLQCARHHQHLR